MEKKKEKEREKEKVFENRSVRARVRCTSLPFPLLRRVGRTI